VKQGKYVALQVATPLIAILFAVLLSTLVILAIGKNPLQVWGTLLRFSLGRSDSIFAILFKSTPLVFTGLASAIAFRLNLFNIGVEGQYQMGAFCAALVGVFVHGLPAWIHLPLVIVAAMAGGMAWAALPAMLKVKRNVHEVISTIMLNYVAFSLIHYFIADVFIDRTQTMGALNLGSPRVRMPLLLPSARMPTVHGFFSLFGVEIPKHIYLNWMLLIGIAVAVILYIVIWKTPFGMELRATAQNPGAAEASGINSKAVMVKVFLISGAVAGLAGLSDLLTYFGYMDIDFPKGYGFEGIAVALLGKNDPFAAILGALLFGFLDRGGEGLQALARVPNEVLTILQGIMILSIVVAYELLTRYIRTQRKREAQ